MSEEQQQLLHPDTNVITLDRVAAMLTTFRADKLAKKIPRNERIPEYLWDMVFVLLETLPESEVIAACGLDRRQLNKERSRRQELSPIAQPESYNSVPATSYQKSFPSLSNEKKGFDINLIATVHKNNGAFMNLYAVNSDITALVSAFLQS